MAKRRIILALSVPEAKRLYKVLWRDDAEGPLIHPLTQSIIDALNRRGLKPPRADFICETFKQQEES